MFVSEVDRVRWFVRVLVQVPDLEVLILVYCEELAHSSCKPSRLVPEILSAIKVLAVGGVLGDFGVVEV